MALSSVGPILAVLILGCFFKPTEAAYTLTDVATVVTTQDVARVFAQGLPLYARGGASFTGADPLGVFDFSNG